MTENPGNNISIMVSEETRQIINSALGPFENLEIETSTINGVINLALSNFTDWLSGGKRYRSLTEQYIDWIESIYSSFLPESEPPTLDRIYNSFNLPYGQASYIARVISSKTLVRWRKIATEELRTVLQQNAEKAQTYINQGDQGQKISIELSQLAYIELLRICSTLKRKDHSYLMPQSAATSGDFRFITIPSCTLIDLLDGKF